MSSGKVVIFALFILPELVLGTPKCLNHNPNRSPFFGDLHVHTARSFDAAAAGTRTTPDEAYRFAKGEAIGLPPFDDQGTPSKFLKLDRPLDFAAVTDHSELFGETNICFESDGLLKDAPSCKLTRGEVFKKDQLNQLFRILTFGFYTALPKPPKNSFICSIFPILCKDLNLTVWSEMQRSANEAQDNTNQCRFTSFIGYEWTGTTYFNNLHRNIIFKDHNVPNQPISYMDIPKPEEMLLALERRCIQQGDGCDVISIPHNSNLSGGMMFIPNKLDKLGRPKGDLYNKEELRRRRDLEPLVEIYQTKGASECLFIKDNPLANQDEFCQFEMRALDICTGNADDKDGCVPLCSSRRIGAIAAMGNSCVEANGFVRSALKEGLLIEEKLGENPFQFGFIASTDTHNGTPGAVEEDGYVGHHGIADDSPQDRIGNRDNNRNLFNVVGAETASPGGLAVVWAEENSRESIFAGMKRRETYATSGSRITLRFFAGSDFHEDLCQGDEPIKKAYLHGVPMGGILSDLSNKPSFYITALADTYTNTPLERLQMIKGYLDGGVAKEEVIDIVKPNEAQNTLCTMWRDESYQKGQKAFYYVRVLEVPTKRWSTLDCERSGIDCSHIKTPEFIQERAWSSPIWIGNQ